MDWLVNLTYTFLWYKSTVKIWGNFYVQFLQKSSSKFQIFHYMETGIQYVEVKQDVEPAFLKNHTKGYFLKFFTAVLTNQDLLILIQKLMLYLWPNYAP